jgi:uncharacterized membrane protein
MASCEKLLPTSAATYWPRAGGRGHPPYGEVVEPTRSVRRFCFTYGPWIVAAAFSLSGSVHLVRPATFTGIVPHFLPFSTSLVYANGVAELTCAIGLWRRQRWAGYAAVILLLAVWPANLQDAITTQEGHDVIVQVVTWLRLPLQIPLIWPYSPVEQKLLEPHFAIRE